MATYIKRSTPVRRTGRFQQIGLVPQSTVRQLIAVDDETAQRLAVTAVSRFIQKRRDDHMAEDDLRPSAACLSLRVDY